MTRTLDDLAPTPPGVEACSCDEALALRRELALARRLIDAMELGGRGLAAQALALRRELALARRMIGRELAAPTARRRAVQAAWAAGGEHGAD